ncbi:MAG TPA: ATP synthase F1 subunit gamma [Bacteroidota bacterium]|nr:ATP synthase F1 subunit gamma [Bacteroidota bacterium]
MATLRDIRRRIAGVKSTQKITKAMKMVAAAKMRRAQESIMQARPYARTMSEMLRHLSSTIDTARFPELCEREEVNAVAVIIVTADRGMCGAFNSNIFKAAAAHIEANYSELNARGKVKLILVGKKGVEFFSKRAYTIYARHIGVFQGLNFAAARSIALEAAQGFVKGEFDRVDIVYNEFKNAAQQRLVVEQFLPVPPPPKEKNQAFYKKIDYIYEPTGDQIIEALVPKHLNFQVWRVLLESNAAEQGARMTAMENASTNARDLIRVLELNYNKARQAAITKELLEIVSGAEALRQAS